MLAAGILDGETPVEFLEGWLIEKMTKHPPHELAKGLLGDRLRELAPSGWFVRDDAPVTTTDSEPEPDIAVARGSRRDFRMAHPGPSDLALAAEIADTSLPRDRGLKKRIDARAGIPTYWIVNLVDRRIEVYTEPSGPVEAPDYARLEEFGPDAEVSVILDGREVGRIAVRAMLP